MLANSGVRFVADAARLRPLHAELLLLGWTVQLAMGVAFWILARFREGAERGEELPVRSAFLLNAGVVTVGLGLSWGAPPAVVLLGRIAEMAAVVAFAGHAYPRVKAFD